MLQNATAYLVAAAFAFSACAVSLYHIYGHLRNYTEPVYQRFIVRIIFMVPVYAISSWFSLVFRHEAIYFDTIRDVYEAWVIYNFLSLCLAYCGGPGAVVVSLEGQVLKPSWWWGTCCLPPLQLDGHFLRHVKQGALLFVFVKPVMAAAALILHSCGLYEEGNFDPTEGYLYISIVYNITYTIALYSLLLFYAATRELLAPFKPLVKFVCIKAVVFATYWQGFLFALLVKFGVLKDAGDSKLLQDFTLCIEMLVAAFLLWLAFPYTEYRAATAVNGEAKLGVSIGHAISFKDVFADTVHQFAPTYHDYVLYSDGAKHDMQNPRVPQNAPKGKRYRTRTFVPTGKEMGMVHASGGAAASSAVHASPGGNLPPIDDSLELLEAGQSRSEVAHPAAHVEPPIIDPFGMQDLRPAAATSSEDKDIPLQEIDLK
eukprot:jgi/Chlat1/1884/Chrsp145S02204